MKISTLFAAALLAACGLSVFDTPILASTGTISMTTQAGARVEGEFLHLAIQVTNQGSAEARQVRIEVETLGEPFGSEDRVSLKPNGTKDFHFQKKIHPALKGAFPLKVLVHFEDANGYPFSALTCTSFSVREKGDAGMPVTSSPLTIKDHGVIQFEVHNTSPDSRRVEATLHVPDEFSSRESKAFFSLEAGERRRLAFSIRNLSALYGAAYPVFMVQESESEGIHSASVSTALVRIVKEGNWFRETRWYWAGGAVFLILFLVVPALTVKSNPVDFSGQLS